MGRFDAIEAELSHLGQALGDAELWKLEHERVNACHILEEATIDFLKLYDSIESGSEYLSDGKNALEPPNDPEVLESLCRSWKNWLTLGDKMIRLLAFLEKHGYQIENSEKLRQRIGFVSTMPLDIAEIGKLRERFKNPGKSIPRKDAFDELYRRADARCN